MNHFDGQLVIYLSSSSFFYILIYNKLISNLILILQVSENSLLSDIIVDQICIFRVEKIQLSNSEITPLPLIAKIDKHETNIDISSLFAPRKVQPIVGFTNEFDSLYQIIGMMINSIYFLTGPIFCFT